MKIYADDPFSMPPKGPADLSLTAVYNTAETARRESKFLSEKIVETNEKVEETNKKVSLLLDMFRELQDSGKSELSLLWDAIKGSQDSSDSHSAGNHTPASWASIVSSPPNNTRKVGVRCEVGMTVPSQVGNALPHSEEASASPVDLRQGPVGLPNSPPPPVPPVEDRPLVKNTSPREISDPLSPPQPAAVEEAGGWQTQASRKKKSASRLPVGPNPNNRDSPRPKPEKRCHVVIHNLHSSVTPDVIVERAKFLTGSDPLIFHDLSCKLKNKVAYRITCLFKHLEVLKGENFGPYVQISRYNLIRDQPPSGYVTDTWSTGAGSPLTASASQPPTASDCPSSVVNPPLPNQKTHSLPNIMSSHGYL